MKVTVQFSYPKPLSRANVIVGPRCINTKSISVKSQRWTPNTFVLIEASLHDYSKEYRLNVKKGSHATLELKVSQKHLPDVLFLPVKSRSLTDWFTEMPLTNQQVFSRPKRQLHALALPGSLSNDSGDENVTNLHI